MKDPESTSTEIPADEFTGKGGAYVIENGVRRRVEDATKPPPHPREKAKPEPKAASTTKGK
jgi:hypothetical protein